MAKRLSEKQKEEIIKFFISGKTIKELSFEFKCTQLTISKNVKKRIGEKKYKELLNINKKFNQLTENTEQNIFEDGNNFTASLFTEIIPLDLEIENSPQKDLSSIPISEVNFPKLVYMIVDKKIELETKYLKDYPEWEFLSEDDLNRKTIQIYFDLKKAKNNCGKDQKVIKVPNTNVFKIVSSLLLSRGISRILTEDQLISI